jgi:hypothetical protein
LWPSMISVIHYICAGMKSFEGKVAVVTGAAGGDTLSAVCRLCCLMSALCSLLSAICCLLSAVCCLLSDAAVYCLLSALYCYRSSRR